MTTRGGLALGALATLAAFAAAMSVGTRPIAAPLAGLLGGPLDPIDRAVLVDIRLPRVLAAALTGAGLGVAGALMQGLTRNPLASPSIAGLNTGAALAMLGGLLLWPGAGLAALSGLAFGGAVAAAAVVFALGALGPDARPARLVLTGATVNLTLGAALVGLVVRFQLHMDLLFWTTGGLMGVTWAQVATLAPATLIGVGAALALTPSVAVLGLGAEAAVGLGLRADRARAAGLACVVLLAGAAVAVIGPVGFVGLIAPHLARGLVGGDPRAVTPLSALVGAAALMLADLGVRALAAELDLPLGGVTAVVGGALFVALVWRRSA